MKQVATSGYVDAFIVAPDGTQEQVVSGANTLLYGCADAVAYLFAGAAEYRPTTIGFVTASTTGLGSNFHFTAGDRKTLTEQDIVGDGLSVHNVPIGQNIKFAATADEYKANQVLFGAMTTDNSSAAVIYGFILKDAQGRVLAVKKLANPQQRAAGYAMSATWSVTFV